MAHHVDPALKSTLGFLPMFSGPIGQNGLSLLTAIVILTIVVKIVSSGTVSAGTIVGTTDLVTAAVGAAIPVQVSAGPSTAKLTPASCSSVAMRIRRLCASGWRICGIAFLAMCGWRG